MKAGPWRPWRFAGLAALTFLLTACIEGAPMDSLDPRGPAARQIDDLFRLTFWVAAGIFIVVEAGILLAVFRFRERPEAPEPRQIHGNPRLEVVWTVIPTLILAAIAVPTFRTVFDLSECSAGAFEVEVIGHQWWFEYRYPDAGVTTANVLVIPEDQEVCLTMTSKDVLHNFWVPNLNGKRYLVPGQETTLVLQADDPGEYWGQCAEFCGLSHAKMRARVEAVTATEFEAWLSAQSQESVIPVAGTIQATGRDVFLESGCTQCHYLAGVNEPPGVLIGPNLTHFASRNVFAGATLELDDPDSLVKWLANPPEIKPGSFMPRFRLSNDDIQALDAYLRSLD